MFWNITAVFFPPSSNRQTPNTLDLHGFYVNEALEALQEVLQTATKGQLCSAHLREEHIKFLDCAITLYWNH